MTCADRLGGPCIVKPEMKATYDSQLGADLDHAQATMQSTSLVRIETDQWV